MPVGHLPRARRLPKAAASHEIRRGSGAGLTRGERSRRGREQGTDQESHEGGRDALVGIRYRAADPDLPGTLEVRPLRCRMATTLPHAAAARVPFPGPQARKDIENGKPSQIYAPKNSTPAGHAKYGTTPDPAENRVPGEMAGRHPKLPLNPVNGLQVARVVTQQRSRSSPGGFAPPLSQETASSQAWPETLLLADDDP